MCGLEFTKSSTQVVRAQESKLFRNDLEHCHWAASTSAAVPIQTILLTAGWCEAQTFARFYNKPIVKDPAFPTIILQRKCTLEYLSEGYYDYCLHVPIDQVYFTEL